MQDLLVPEIGYFAPLLHLWYYYGSLGTVNLKTRGVSQELTSCRDGAVIAQTSGLLHIRPGNHQQSAKLGSWGIQIQCLEHGRAVQSEGGDTSECQWQIAKGGLFLRVSHQFSQLQYANLALSGHRSSWFITKDECRETQIFHLFMSL